MKRINIRCCLSQCLSHPSTYTTLYPLHVQITNYMTERRTGGEQVEYCRKVCDDDWPLTYHASLEAKLPNYKTGKRSKFVCEQVEY